MTNPKILIISLHFIYSHFLYVWSESCRSVHLQHAPSLPKAQVSDLTPWVFPRTSELFQDTIYTSQYWTVGKAWCWYHHQKQQIKGTPQSWFLTFPVWAYKHGKWDTGSSGSDVLAREEWGGLRNWRSSWPSLHPFQEMCLQLRYCSKKSHCPEC